MAKPKRGENGAAERGSDARGAGADAEFALDQALAGLGAEELLADAAREHVLYLWVSAPERAEIRFVAGLLGLSAGEYLRRLHQRAKVGLLDREGSVRTNGGPGRIDLLEVARVASVLGLSVEEYFARMHDLARKRILTPEE